MRRKLNRTEWRAIALDVSVEASAMEVLDRKGGFRRVPYARLIFRTGRGEEFGGPRISAKLRRSLERQMHTGPWLRVPKARR